MIISLHVVVGPNQEVIQYMNISLPPNIVRDSAYAYISTVGKFRLL